MVARPARKRRRTVVDVAIGLPYLRSFALAFGSVVHPSVTEMLLTHMMLRVDFEPTLFSHQRQVFPDPYATVVEEYVMVGAQAEDVLQRIRPVVRGA